MFRLGMWSGAPCAGRRFLLGLEAGAVVIAIMALDAKCRSGLRVFLGVPRAEGAGP